MRVIRSPKIMASVSKRFKSKSKKIGFVPTMGCLHEGHLSLIRKARKENKIVIVSIFVNPTQFSPKEDYKSYPRSIKKDKDAAQKAGADIIFYPSAKAMYPNGYSSSVEVGNLGSLMCGAKRPSHFKGVATVCTKLFNIVLPDTAYFGQKDYQQALIIKKLIEDLNLDFKIRVLPIVREKSGLAMSSRNKYLTAAEKENAKVLYKALKKARSLIKAGEKDPSRIKQCMRHIIHERPGIIIDYIVIADPKTLNIKKRIDSRVLIALAAKVGKARLIDNVIV